ncbi:hypothetical protein HWI79_1887 [Cryptosporidium felis]|nr:hypothetical protein HWI79_1887 [Cryptosporidium felis]
MKSISFVKLILTFAVIAFIGNFESVTNRVSTNTLFEQSFIRLRLGKRKLSKDDRKSLERSLKINEDKLGAAQLKGDQEKIKLLKAQRDKIRKQLGEE